MSMLDIEKLSEDEFEALTDRAFEFYNSAADEALLEVNEDLRNTISRLNQDDDYHIELSARNANAEDEYDSSLGSSDEVLCVGVIYVAEDGSLKNDIHVADVFLNAQSDSTEFSILWMPEE